MSEENDSLKDRVRALEKHVAENKKMFPKLVDVLVSGFVGAVAAGDVRPIPAFGYMGLPRFC